MAFKKVNHLASQTPFLMTFIATSTAIKKDMLCGFTSGKLVLCTADIRPVCIALEDASASDALVLCEMLGPEAIVEVAKTGSGTPAIGGLYDSDTTGLLLDADDTTDYKLMPIEYDSVNGVYRCLIVNYAQKT